MKKINRNSAWLKVGIALFALLLVYFLQTVDVFYLRNLNLFGGNFISPAVAVVITVAASLFLKYRLGWFCFRRAGIIVDTFLGVLFSVVSSGICLLAGIGWLYFKGNGVVIPEFSVPYSIGEGLKGTVLSFLIYALAVLIEAVFKEMFFRGFLISQFSQKTGIHTAIVIQAFLYTFASIPLVVSMLSSEKMSVFSSREKAAAVAAFFLGELLCAFRWGLYYNINSNVWMSLSEHIVLDIVINCIVLQGVTSTLFGIMTVRLAVNVISFLICLPVYFHRDRINANIAEEMKIAREMAGMPPDNYSPSPLRSFVRRMEKNGGMKNRTSSAALSDEGMQTGVDFSDVVRISRDEFFKNIDAFSSDASGTGAVMGETEQTGKREKIKTVPAEQMTAEPEEETAIPEKNGNSPEEKQEEKASGEKVTEEKASEEKSVKNENISKLVQGYFNEEFNKHTFN